jgi:hypothetical protein
LQLSRRAPGSKPITLSAVLPAEIRRCGARREEKNAQYRPYSRVGEGNCFLLSATAANESAAARKLAYHEQSGLPVYAFDDRNGALAEVTDWEACPFLPENGFGEISVEDACFVARLLVSLKSSRRLHVGSGEDAEDDAMLVLEEDKAELKRGMTSPRVKTRPPRRSWAALYSRLFVQLHVHHDHDEDE